VRPRPKVRRLSRQLPGVGAAVAGAKACAPWRRCERPGGPPSKRTESSHTGQGGQQGGPGWAWTRLDLDSSYRQILAVRLYVWSRMEASSTANLRQQAVADWDERLGWLKSNMPLPVFQAVDRIEMRSSGCGRPICFLQEQDIGAPQGSGLPNQCNAIIGSANTEQ
jgi:hypothetical protein